MHLRVLEALVLLKRLLPSNCAFEVLRRALVASSYPILKNLALRECGTVILEATALLEAFDDVWIEAGSLLRNGWAKSWIIILPDGASTWRGDTMVEAITRFAIGLDPSSVFIKGDNRMKAEFFSALSLQLGASRFGEAALLVLCVLKSQA